MAPLPIDDETERLAPAEHDSEWWLVVVDEGRSIAHRLPSSRPLSIGRSDDNDIQIDHPSISRRHAQLLVGPPVCIQDLRSANGVRVGRKPLEPMFLTPVEPGQAIELGGVLTVVHRPSMLPPGALPPQPDDPLEERPSLLPGGPMLIRDPAMHETMDLVRRVAPSALSVLLSGETGVGKELVAEAVHRGSPRADRRFVRVNCAALAESVAESELFGHERGAFTGAAQSRAGIFETASGGTVFLDEVGELVPSLQAKLLRVLEAREIRRVGSAETRKVDVRFVSASNRNLREEVAQGRFREDLYFRLNGIQVQVPALRDRPQDILPLARRFVRRGRPNHGPVELAPALAEALEAYSWPGNVRQLRNVMERMSVLARGAVLRLEDLPEELRSAELRSTEVRSTEVRPTEVRPTEVRSTERSSDGRQHVRDAMRDMERQRIVDALERTGGNQTQAAALIGMPRRTFIKRLDAYGIPRPRKGGSKP